MVFTDEEGWGHRSGGAVRRASSLLLKITVIFKVISSFNNYVLSIYYAEGSSEALGRDGKYNCPNSYFQGETDDEQVKTSDEVRRFSVLGHKIRQGEGTENGERMAL